MYQVLVERAAEKDLKRLSAGIRSRITIALRGLAEIRDRPVVANSLALGTTAAFEWAITGSIYEIADVIRVVRVQRDLSLNRRRRDPSREASPRRPGNGDLAIANFDRY